jgi:hypothetical protein
VAGRRRPRYVDRLTIPRGRWIPFLRDVLMRIRCCCPPGVLRVASVVRSLGDDLATLPEIL